MEYNNSPMSLSRPLLTAVFAGFVTTLICLFYNVLYRDLTDFELADIINVSSLIFLVNLLFLIIGFIYYFFLRKFKKGELLYMVLFVLLTVFFTWEAEGVNRATDHANIVQFRGLLAGIVIIIGVSASLLLPYLFHNKRFSEGVL